MGIKIDLEKAYDHLSWDFIEQSLRDFSLPPELIDAIMMCVCSVSFQVLWNGEATDKFIPSCGIRQGDLLSPYIFFICMDRLSHLIEDMVEVGDWRPFLFRIRGPIISHLMFADDLMLFAEASSTQMMKIMGCLQRFCEASDQIVNTRKTHIYFSKNVDTTTHGDITACSGFMETAEIGRYLGAYILEGRNKRQAHAQSLDKIKNKLKGWKQKCLSMAGRVVLAQSAITPGAILPNATWLNSKSVCWEMINHSNALWVRALNSKYGISNSTPSVRATSGCSALWKSLSQLWPIIQESLVHRVGNGCSTKFWKDDWLNIGDHLLKHKLPSATSGDEDNYVCDFVNNEGEWKIEHLKQLLPDECIQRICANPPPRASDPPDKLAWKHSMDGRFSVKSAYCYSNRIQSQRRERPIAGHISIQEYACEVGKAINKQVPRHDSRVRRETIIKWYPAPEGWIKVNTDGAAKNNPGKAGCGGLIRNSDGSWVMDFTRNLGVCSAYMAELWGLYLGLEMAWTLGFRKVKIEIDSQAVINSVTQNRKFLDDGSMLYCRIQELMERNWTINMVHTYRETNACADWLANFSLEQNCSTQYWNSPPAGIEFLLLGDVSGVAHPCNIVSV
ncbi:uncharacterized protein LOC107620837 [Arachis ipaensis]|uniref:uncharacterized protein LOC107620837 n=1 Tax=Arachis ipaensis TaxID=130454 RepID=UPI0007AF2569|nr:uncharacterized protein LOC107620837 [Arachis ipaensis]XP_025685288.1 uncharacterized protein LOC112786082 [Arachis hypogaea]